ncbi:glycosyltransferase family 39 protein [candidate division TA06 bacterium]|uniref:Glycosyltransferase family 39 protein n=1 Tax=candidate division TA06 bacterium TaxID=2250710 RepID=A0A933IDI6_UNCT6|nr:glycosyltransferase family 39 protein [candidate division TA06 bacterium]
MAGIVFNQPTAIPLILQITLSCLTVYLVYLITLKIFLSRPAALAASLLYAGEPQSVLYSAKLMTETLFAFLLAGLLYLLILYLTRPRLRFLLAAAATGTALAYVRPIGYYLPFLIALFIGINSHIRHRFWSVFFPPLLLFLLLSYGLLLPWQVRNSRQAGYSGFSAIADCNLYFHTMPAIMAHQPGREYTEIKAQMKVQSYEDFCRAQSELPGDSQGAALRQMKRQALFAISRDIPFFTWLHVKGMLRTLIGPGATEFIKLFNLKKYLPGKMDDQLGMLAPLSRIIYVLVKNPVFTALAVFLDLVLALYLFLSIYPSIKRKIHAQGPVLLLLTVTLYFIILSGGFVGQSRLRHPIMPIICIFAGYGLHLFWTQKNWYETPAAI